MSIRSCARIDTGILAENYRILRGRIPRELRLMAVVKADAYGHGAVETARVLQAQGCEDFAVACTGEALELRAGGIRGQILILGWSPAEDAERLRAAGITQALLSEEHAAALAGRGLMAQFALDTGMNRIGLDAEDPAACERTIRAYAGGFTLTGLSTHLCAADDPAEDEFTRLQIRRFREVADRVKDLGLPYLHCMNSAGALRLPPAGSLVRLGIVLYGLRPDPGMDLPEGIRPALTWQSTVSMVKSLRPGETVGYGRTFRAEREMRLATIPTGYADGYDRRLSGKGIVTIRGRQAPVVGRVCMDQLMADVSGIPDAAPGDEVTLLGPGFGAEEMAQICGTIPYEIVCGIGKRVPRVYAQKNEETRRVRA